MTEQNITVVIPTSPIPSHPDTAILEETVDSVRHHLPDAEIFLTFDGVREEQRSHMEANYDEFTRRALWLADHSWKNVCPFIFQNHEHQTGMMRHTLHHIETPLLMYVEHDTPLMDRDIKWEAVTELIMTGAANLVRFHHFEEIPPEHQHMMCGDFMQYFVKTTQWSQRPHVADTAWYRGLLKEHFSADAKSFIEDKMHGVVDGTDWRAHKLTIYHPPEGIQRSYHLDGRAGGPKYDDTQQF